MRQIFTVKRSYKKFCIIPFSISQGMSTHFASNSHLSLMLFELEQIFFFMVMSQDGARSTFLYLGTHYCYSVCGAHDESLLHLAWLHLNNLHTFCGIVIMNWQLISCLIGCAPYIGQHCNCIKHFYTESWSLLFVTLRRFIVTRIWKW